MFKSGRRQVQAYRRIWDSLLNAISGGGPVPITYLLRATWDSAADQGYANAQVISIPAEGVEDGALVITETDGAIECESNRLKLSGKVANSYALGAISQGAIGAQLARSLIGIMRYTGAPGSSFLCWDNDGILSNPSLGSHSFLSKHTVGTNIYIGNPPFASLIIETGYGMSADMDYSVAIVYGGFSATADSWRTGQVDANYLYGATFFIKGGAFATWSLLYRGWLSSQANLYPLAALHTAARTSYFDNIRVPVYDYRTLLEPIDYIATPVAGNTFNRDTNGNFGFKVTTLPTAGQIEVAFRYQDASNFWQVTINTAGDLELDEVVGGVPTQRAIAAGVIAAGESVETKSLAREIRIFDSAARRISYNAAVNFELQDNGKVITLGTGGVIEYLWTQDRTNAAYDTLLDAA